ncbi:hypothetical protein PUNSTDRAFT_142120 [Punctularia strigosozonata HHB-11173 SS5]|uniref:uncharacterized protein n=1 Tax=Punctularia strigosozonata (strain HHB-11173) TaxID=741275 RepID=UPI000441673E|nr:uncharacterized protein PUNSTDRAFT_142120 [Punctularia strigosozonata HHB-11173 SS5]EIN11909.1 hypothetical protein PUNSTDRAFT_142120 [Punctularia strigosozonata HHB-11173 SS5]
MYPKLVALDTDWTIFSGWLNSNEWGKGPNATPLIQNNILKVTEWEVRDQSNYDLVCIMYADIPRIIQDIKKHGAKLAIVSRNTSKELCDRALWYFYAYDAHGNKRSLIDLVDFDEIYDEDKVNHFRKIKGWTNFHYSDMVLYDDEAINNTVEMILGVTFQVSRDQRGLTWDNYQDGLAMWRRNRGIHSPWRGLDVHLYPKRKLIGYSAMDLDTIKLLEAGGRRQDRTEGARWGYAMYVTDNPTIAKFFSEWIKKTTFGPQASTMVCAIYARDSDIFHRMNKVENSSFRFYAGNLLHLLLDMDAE